MSDSNRVSLAYIAESTLGQTPATPELQQLRFTGEGLKYNIQNIVSQEIRSDRQTTDLIQTAASVSGPINFELSYGAYDDFLLASLFTDGQVWSTAVTVSGTVNITQGASPDTDPITVVDSAVGGAFTNLALGQIVRLSGFSNAANNGYFRVLTITDGDNITLDPDGTSVVTETGGNLSGQYAREGVQKQSFTIEKGFNDITQFQVVKGCLIGELNLQFAAQAILNGSFEFLGTAADPLAAVTIDNDSTYTPAAANQVMNAVSNVVSLKEGGLPVGSPNFIQAGDLTLSNNLREQYAVGSLGMIGVGSGKIDLTGNLTTYFGSEVVYDKFVNGSETSLFFAVEDAAGNAYSFNLPRIKFEDGDILAAGQDQDVFANIVYRAIRDATYGFTFEIGRFPAGT